jgi:outer membrane protein assembly factor BamB
VASAATTICCGVAIGVSLLLPQTPPTAGQVVPPVPATTPAAPPAEKPPPPSVTYEPAWQRTIDSDAALQIVTGAAHVFVTGAKARLTAFTVADGAEAWTKELSSDARLATGDGMLFIASGEKLHALLETTGDERWGVSLPGPTTGPAWSKGLVVFSNGLEIVACRSADGSEIWRQPLGAEVELPIVVSDGRVIAALANRTLVVLDLPTGAIRKRMLLTAKPGELAGSEDRVYFGADDGAMYAYRAGSEDPVWVFPRIHVNIVGAPVADDRCVYAAFMDNSVRAFRHGSGTFCWSARALTGRPASGPMLSGGQLVIPLTTSDLVVIEARDGKPVRRPTVAAQPSSATLQAISASPDGTSIYIVSVGGDQRRVLTARRRK